MGRLPGDGDDNDADGDGGGGGCSLQLSNHGRERKPGRCIK